jgi:hypothetical protein
VQSGDTYLSFSGGSWLVKKSSSITGPGSNYFYYNTSSSYVDGNGYLHLGIFNVNGKRYASEVNLTQSLGYGTYSITIQGDISRLDKCAVFGFYTWDDRAQSAQGNAYNREIDIEMSKWCDASNSNAEMGVQPETSGMYNSYNLGYTGDIVASFNWKAGEVDFLIKQASTGIVISQWNYIGSGVPTPGAEKIRINLWPFEAPTATNLAVVIKSFNFTK